MFNYFEEFDSQSKVFDAQVKWQPFDLSIDESVYIDLKREAVQDENAVVSKNVDTVIRREMQTSKISMKQSAPKREPRTIQRSEIFSALEFICLSEHQEGSTKSSHCVGATCTDVEHLKEFDFIPSYDENEVIPAVKGRLERVVGERILGSLVGGDCLPVNVNDANNEANYFHVVSLSREKIAKFSGAEVEENQRQKRDVGHLILKLSSKVARVGIDRPYEDQKYLDDKFNVVEDFENAEYVVFTNVSAGNVLVSIYGQFGETELVAHIFLDEVSFENIELERLEKYQVNIFKKDLLATIPLEVDLPEEKIWAFNHPREHAIKLSNSMYEIRNVTYPLGTRRYLEVSYLDDTLMVGLEDSKIIEIPSPSLYKMILDETGVTSLKRACVIQMNLKEPCKELKAKGYSELSQEGIEQFYLDSDGKITNELSELTEKIFFVGSFNGVVDVSVENFKKDKKIFRTFCAEDVYLVEQL
ncbi:MAG: hypothetical protein A2X86_04975 [Bdellovibrionales bacterium GWA2_49_15]|nr:MAG: hypothetical protein A2X86_04975 [Bdellovibrionales bacterium GWA2_49_15]